MLSQVSLPYIPSAQFTCSQLHPGTHLVDSGSIAEEEETEADDAADDEEGGDPHEKHGCLEGTGGDGPKVQGAALTDEFSGKSITDAVGIKAKVASLGSVNAVPDPVRLDESHHHDHSKAEGEKSPQDPHSPGISYIVGMVDFGSLLGWQHLPHGEAECGGLLFLEGNEWGSALDVALGAAGVGGQQALGREQQVPCTGATERNRVQEAHRIRSSAH